MPNKEVVERAKRDLREGKSPSTLLGNLFARRSTTCERENMAHVRLNRLLRSGSVKRDEPAFLFLRPLREKHPQQLAELPCAEAVRFTLEGCQARDVALDTKSSRSGGSCRGSF